MSYSYLSLTSSPVPSHVIGASTLFYTDGETVLSLGGPWTAHIPLDIGLNGSTLFTAPFGTSAIIGGERMVGGFPYLGSINPDGNGQLSTPLNYMPSPRWDVWNFTNQRPITMIGGNTNPAKIQVTAAPGHSITGPWFTVLGISHTIFTGLPADVTVEFLQAINTLAPPGGSAWGTTSISLGSGSIIPLGFWGEFGLDNGIIVPGNGTGPGATPPAEYLIRNNVGAQIVNGICWAFVNASNTYQAVTSFDMNGEDNNRLKSIWLG